MKKLSLLPSDLDTKCSFTLSLMSMMGFFVASFVLCSVIFSVSIVLRDPPSDAALHEPSSLTPLLQIAQTLQGTYLFPHPCFPRQNSDQCYGKMLKNKAVTDSTVNLFHVRHCEDMSWGIKLVDSDSYR
ncbi:hypothetical protein JHK85_047572 [Glycine max]|nr:hypothetical protein JHK85_047572 [Glycine max]